MKYVEYEKNAISILNEFEVSEKEIQKELLRCLKGSILFSDNQNRIIGYLKYDHLEEEKEIKDCIKRNVPFIYENEDIKNKISFYINQSPYNAVFPLIDKEHKLKKIYYAEDDLWINDIVDSYDFLIFRENNNIKDLDRYFLNHNYKNIALFGVNKFSLRLADMLQKKYNTIHIMGLFDFEKNRPYCKENIYNADVNVEYINSIEDVLAIKCDMIIICDWTMRHLNKMNILKNHNVKIEYFHNLYTESAYRRYHGDYVIEQCRRYTKSLGAKMYTIRIPSMTELGKKEKVLTYEDRLKWLSKETGIEAHSQEMDEFNLDRRAFITQTVKNKSARYFADYRSKYVNIIGKTRLVLDVPSDYEYTIFLVGPCIVTGMYTIDKYTLGTILQRKLNSLGLKYRVVAVGIHNDVDRFLFLETLKTFKIKPNDMIFWFEQSFQWVKWDFDFSDIFKELFLEYGEDFYYDSPVHVGKEGNKKFVSFLISNIISKIEDFQESQVGGGENVEEISSNELTKFEVGLIENRFTKHLRIGSIVMNCNPFTLGHQYLIETAIKSCDYLYIFVVEEDKSIFSFKERFKLVQEGTSHLKNITVLPSGKFIISQNTFSAYFQKENLKDAIIDPSMDLEIFGRKVVPTLDINIRFVGEEPIDNITRQYNEYMKRMLPEYGIEVIEIPRKEIGKQVISASRVRKLLLEENWKEIKKIVPKTTYQYLWTERENLLNMIQKNK